MLANVDAMVEAGIRAYRAGNKDEAKTLLLKAVEIDERNEKAWLWLSAVVDSPEEQRICLENVLAVNPNNERAQQGLKALDQKASSPPARADDIVAGASFTPQPSRPAAPPPPPPVEEFPTSIEWEAPPTASSSASSTRPVKEPSAEDYDDWLSGLNLGKSGGLDDLERIMSGSAFEDDDNEDIGFAAGAAAIPDDLFDSSAGGPFSAAAEADFDFLDSPAPAPSKPRRDDLGEFPASPSPGRAVSSWPKTSPPPAPEPDESDFDQASLEYEPSEMFRVIPDDITATRLPGTRERYPILALLLLLLGLAANGGAVALLISRLTGAF
jgi:hypothetical protein